MSPIPDDYVSVDERIRLFMERYPEGSLQSVGDPKMMTGGDKSFIVYCAAAYRTPDDPRPGMGWAWEPVPGPTNFTRDSELMNAETSAWGRAIVALGFATKKIASSEEVRNRQPVPAEAENGSQGATGVPAEPGQLKEIREWLIVLDRDWPASADPNWTWADECRKYTSENFEKTDSKKLTKAEAEQLRAWLETRKAEREAEEKIPFA